MASFDFTSFITNSYETFKHYADGSKRFEASGEPYKLIPATAGLILVGVSIKDFFRATFGYNQLNYRQKLFFEAKNSTDKPFLERCALVNKAVFGTMPGKLRAKIYIRAICESLIGAALTYPLFSREEKIETDVEKFAHQDADSYLQSAAASKGAGEVHQLGVASRLYNFQTSKIHKHVISPEIPKNIQNFYEGVLNPPQSALEKSPRFNQFYKNTCASAEKPMTQTRTRFCDLLEQHTYKPLFQTHDGITHVNKKQLDEGFKTALGRVKKSPQTIDEMGASLLQSVCDYTLGFTPLADKCHGVKQRVAPYATNRKEQAIDILGKMYGDLQNHFENEGMYERLLHPKTSSEFSQAADHFSHIQNHKPDFGVSETLLDVILGSNPKIKDSFLEFFEIKQSPDMSKEQLLQEVSKKYREIAKNTHPDRVGNAKLAAQFMQATEFKKIIAANPEIFKGTCKQNPNFFEKLSAAFQAPSKA